MQVTVQTHKAGNHHIEIREITNTVDEVVGASMTIDLVEQGSIRRVGVAVFSVVSGQPMLRISNFRIGDKSEILILPVDGKDDKPVSAEREPEFGPLVYTEADYAPAA